MLSSCGVVAALMQTTVVPLIPAFPQLLNTSASSASWVITATLLSATVSTPVVGRLGDMYGKRRVLLINLVVLIAGCVLSALTSSLVPMVLGRAMQGTAMGTIPLGISMLRDLLPADQLGSAMALLSATLGVGGSIGFPVSALVAEHADWHVIFWMSGGLGVVSAILVATMVPESDQRTGGRFDVPGTAGLVTGLVCLLLAISKGTDWGWGSPLTLGLLTAAVVVLLAWARFELRTARPLVDLRVSARTQVLFTNLATILVGFAMYAMALILPQLLQAPVASGYGLGTSMIVAGLCIAPGGITMLVISPVAARISESRGPRTSLLLGIGVIGVGYVLGLLLMHAVWQIVIVSTVISTGVALGYAAMPALIMRAVPRSETAAANGLNALMRSLGTALSAAVLGVVLTHSTISVDGRALPSLAGLQISFVIAAVGALGGLLLALFIPRAPRTVIVTRDAGEPGDHDDHRDLAQPVRG